MFSCLAFFRGWLRRVGVFRMAGIESFEGAKHFACELGVVSLGRVVPSCTKYVQEQSARKHRLLGL